MSIKETIHSEMKVAMRAKDKDRLGTIRLIQAEFKRVEVDERIELDESRVISILDKMLKQRRDSISQFEAANRHDLADKEKAEVCVIQSFLPSQLSLDEINQLIHQAIEQSGAQDMKAMGSVMAILKPQLEGRADTGEVSKLVKARLS